MAAVVAIATCCGSAAAAALRGGSPIATVVPLVTPRCPRRASPHGDGRVRPKRLGGRERGDDRCHPVNTETGVEPQPSETRASGEATGYLKVEQTRFLFLEGSPDAVAAAGVAATAPPDTSTMHAGASATRAASSVDLLVAGAPAPAPGARSSIASTTLSEGGAGSHLSGGLPPITLFFLSFPRRRVLRGCWRGESLLLAQPIFFVPLFPMLPPPEPSLLLTRHSLLLPSLCRARARARGVGGSDHAAFTATLYWEEQSIRVTAAHHGGMKKKEEAYSPAGRRGA
jgi:hypothetical protein